MESVYNNFEINFRADNFTQQEQQQHTHTQKKTYSVHVRHRHLDLERTRVGVIWLFVASLIVFDGGGIGILIRYKQEQKAIPTGAWTVSFY